jgi:hypothetical protein
MTGQQIGLVIGSVAGCGWALAGSAALRGASRSSAVIVSMVVSALLGVASARLPANGTSGFDGAIYGMVVSAEAIAIVVAVILLRRSGNAGFVPPVIALIVGLHFLGLWRATHGAIFVAIAVGLCLVGIAGMRGPAERRLLVSGFGCAAVLWASVAWTVLISCA